MLLLTASGKAPSNTRYTRCRGPGFGCCGRSLNVAAYCSLALALPVLPASATAQEPDTLTEIIVTARKVEERVQDIPASVQVLTGAYLDTANLTRLYDLQFNVPGLVVNNLGMFGAGIALRGVADQGGSDRSVAAHLDGVYLGTSGLAIARMFDLERIEVLKGPQGTLYGRNSTGGSINFITRSPADELSADIEAAYGSFDTARVEGNVNVPMQNAAVRLAFIGSEGDGYIRNSVDNRRFAESDFWGLRAALRWNPSDVLRVNVMLQHIEDDGATDDHWTPQPPFLADPSDIHLATVTLANPYLLTDTDNASLSIDYELGFGLLTSITGYARSEVRALDDCAGSPQMAGCVRGADPERYSQWSQEFIFGSSGDSELDWLVGASVFDGERLRNFRLVVPAASESPLTDSTSTFQDTVYAVFGQLTAPIAGPWRVTAGIRLSNESRSVTDVGTGLLDNLTLQKASNDWDGDSWRVDLEYAVSDETLAYVGISTGFKSAGLTTTVQPDGELDSFDAEELTAYEAGVKTRLADGRLDLSGAAFFYDFRDLQVGYLDEDLTTTFVDNAAAAEVIGFDISGLYRASERISIGAGVVWLPKREFVDYLTEVTGVDLSGNELSRAPEWSASASVDYQQPWRNLGHFSARVEYSYRSDFYYTKDNDPRFWQDAFSLLNLFLRFEAASEKWYLFASGRNLTDEDYFNQVFIQSSPGYPDTYEIGAGYRF